MVFVGKILDQISVHLLALAVVYFHPKSSNFHCLDYVGPFIFTQDRSLSHQPKKFKNDLYILTFYFVLSKPLYRKAEIGSRRVKGETSVQFRSLGPSTFTLSNCPISPRPISPRSDRSLSHQPKKSQK